jgi:hypothetical protein
MPRSKEKRKAGGQPVDAHLLPCVWQKHFYQANDSTEYGTKIDLSVESFQPLFSLWLVADLPCDRWRRGRLAL